MSNRVWVAAARLLARHLAGGERLDFLLQELPTTLPAVDRRRCRHLLYGAVRHLALLDSAIGAQVRQRPRPLLRAALLLGAFELMEDPAATPAIVHHAVGQTRRLASAGEARLVNAVLRRVPAVLESVFSAEPADAAGLARRYSHPAWLVERWLARFGSEATHALLRWDQEPAPVHARLIAAPEAASGGGAAGPADLPAFFQRTGWEDFWRLDKPDWETVEQWLAAGRLYLQDPATALAPALLAPAAGETVLDLCAAPGGKTLQLAAAVLPGGRVVAVDLPGPRLGRLLENLARHPDLPVAVAGLDATRLAATDLEALGFPARFDAVLLDVPCSNTGVLRHRVDAKWRLRPADLEALPRLQAEILRRGAALVRPGGRLVYSTCSLEAEENEDVVAAFAAGSGGGFALERSEFSRPWESGRDGAAAFLLRRRA